MYKLKDLSLKNCKKISDNRGDIYISELSKIFNLKIERIFFVNGKKNQIRGEHAHKLCNQIIFCIDGKITITISDGVLDKNITLSNFGEYIFLPKKFWSKQKFLTAKSRIMVCCDRKYEKNDYIYSLPVLLELKKND